MNSALAIASVTAVLKNLLDNGLIHQSVANSVGEVIVTALPPDRIPLGAEERSQLNLYLYRVTPNSGWRSFGTMPSQDECRWNPPLALDLHYLLTVYGERDFQAEILLGCALQVFHETTLLSRDAIRAALAPGASGNPGSMGHPTLAALSTSDLADQVEQIKISPEFLSMEEMSKLWSGLQARYRLSATYQVSVVSIEDRRHDADGQRDAPQAMLHELQGKR
jgi:Pvc16 N-terminal domain